MKTQQSTQRQGFTLIELLTVITIIVILAGLSLGIFSWANRASTNRKAEGQLRLLENGIQQYYADAGAYPSASGGGGANGGRDSLLVYRMCFGDGVGPDGIVGTADDGQVDGRPDEGAEVYIDELDPNAGNSSGWFDKTPVPGGLYDPWGKFWWYRSGDATSVNPDFDLWSSGQDGRSSARGGSEVNEDDVTNW